MVKINKKYVCLGSDQAMVSEEQYKNGLIECGGECNMHGHAFVEGGKCKICGRNYAISAPHDHKN